MDNDAKLGLVVGVGVVLAVAVLFFRKDSLPTKLIGEEASASAVANSSTTSPPERESVIRQTARPIVRPVSRRHTVQEGDTLASLAKTFYGDSAHAEEIYHANRDVIPDPEQLMSGVVLFLPESER